MAQILEPPLRGFSIDESLRGWGRGTRNYRART